VNVRGSPDFSGRGGEVWVPCRAVKVNGGQVVANGVTFEAQGVGGEPFD
jgi:hypothetical protein